MWQGTTPFRRLTLRIEAPKDVCVFWQCGGRDGISRVRNISLGGIFIEARRPGSASAVTKLYFLVPEGQIRADAVVRHAEPDSGVGLKFTAVSEKDRPKLAALMTRLRSLCRSSGKLQ